MFAIWENSLRTKLTDFNDFPRMTSLLKESIITVITESIITVITESIITDRSRRIVNKTISCKK